MDTGSTQLDVFTTRVRQMILQYNELKEENRTLQAETEGLRARIGELERELRQAHNDYDSLKLARMVSITDGDMETAQKHLAKLIRDVNKCITLVSERQ